MDGKLRNMSSIYLSKGDKMLLLYRQGSRVVNNMWIGSAGGHFEEDVSTELTSNEGKLKWFDNTELRVLEMPFTSRFVMDHYIETGRNNDLVYGGVADGEKVVFVNLPEF